MSFKRNSRPVIKTKISETRVKNAHPASKLFGGEIFFNNGVATTRAKAKTIAAQARKGGKNARIVDFEKTGRGHRFSIGSGVKAGRYGVYTKDKPTRKKRGNGRRKKK